MKRDRERQRPRERERERETETERERERDRDRERGREPNEEHECVDYKGVRLRAEANAGPCGDISILCI